MDGELQHHGIKGQRWGVRRTPAQLGHAPKGSKIKKVASDIKNKLTKSKKSKSGPSEMSDEELRNRINRLNMEEQYSNLVARQKDRDTSKFRKMLGSAFESLAKKGFDYAVDWTFKKIFEKEDPDKALQKEVDRLRNEDAKRDLLEKRNKTKFDIDQWRDADVNTMDYETIQQVSKWYTNAQLIKNGRKNLSSP